MFGFDASSNPKKVGDDWPSLFFYYWQIDAEQMQSILRSRALTHFWAGDIEFLKNSERASPVLSR